MKNRFILSIYIIINLCTVSAVKAGDYHLLPQPQKFTPSHLNFRVNKVQLSTPVLQQEWETLISEIRGTVSPKATGTIEVKLLPTLPEIPMSQNEAYQLSITKKRTIVEAVTERDVYWAMQTLRQLAEKRNSKAHIQGAEIIDWPAFRVRGFMQDAGRSCISLDELKREIVALAKFKINVSHWHLTENQSWRLESKIFPMPSDSANTTRMPGKYYTPEEAKELVALCKAHHMTLIPEIDTPGHSAAFIRTFRHDMQSPEGMKILKLLMDKVCETLDVPYLHIGTDEVQFTNPRFAPEMVSYVRPKSKKVALWNPGWHYKPGEIDMTQLWSYRGKAQKGTPTIDSRLHYLNHFDTFGDIIALYNSYIYNKEQGNGDLARTILAIWNDGLVSTEWGMIIENNFCPNMLAMAERVWKGGGTKHFNKNGTIFPTDEHSELFKSFADFERRLLRYKEHTSDGYPFAYVRQTNVKWNITDAFPNEGNLAKAFPPEEALQDGYSYGGKTYNVRPAIGAGIYLHHVWGTLIPGFYKEPKENHTAYVYTHVYSPKEQNVGLWAEFQNYGRSEADLPSLPGRWDYKESRIQINEQEILPPVWTATHCTKSNEITLGNESYVTRLPLKVRLQKGWNKVLLKLLVGKFVNPEVRLVKWMLTTIFVTLDGQKAVEGLIYLPNKTLEWYIDYRKRTIYKYAMGRFEYVIMKFRYAVVKNGYTNE